jgi:hypothetical protein
MKTENEVKTIAAGKIGIIIPKSKPEICFNYSGTEDLENLISFAGIKPTLDFEKGKLIPKFKKLSIPENSYVLRSGTGELRILSESDLNGLFEVQAVSDYKKEYSQVIIAQPKK